MFNACMNNDVVPTDWTLGIINPIPKSGNNDPRVPLNYRGISLLSVAGKLFTAAISSRISQYLESNNMLANEQNGFRAERSCLDHIFSLQDVCNIRNKLRQSTFLTFIDFSKAFDFINHELLYHKLLNLNINGKIYNSIRNIYARPQSCVQLNGILTEWFPVSSGVRQGDSLSPLLFACYINDLPPELNGQNAGVYMGGEQLSLLMYADDIVMLAPNEDKAQKQLDVMTEWCGRWGMHINPKKSQIVHVRNYQRERSKVALHCCGHELKYVDTYKYLGFILHEHLSPQKTVEALTLSASRSFGRIVNVFKKLKNMGFGTYETLYDSYVKSIMNYGAAVWGYAEQSEPQVLQNRIQRYFLGVNKYTPTAATRTEFDWLDPKYQRWIDITRYWNRLLKMKSDRIPVLVYKWDKSLHQNCWVEQVKQILQHCNMYDCMLNNVPCDLEVLEARLKVLNRNRWWLEANDKPKLRTYIQIHDNSLRQIIVRKNLTRSQRSIVTKFKCGVLPIMIETGRYKDVPLEKRLCQICTDKCIEDEQHFIGSCKALSHVRNSFKERFEEVGIDVQNVNIECIGKMLQPNCIKLTAEMLTNLFEARKELMYDLAVEEEEIFNEETHVGEAV